MKKIVSFALLVMIMLTLSACSNKEFTLHSNTRFGMTITDVISEEQKHGFFMDTTETDSEGNQRIILRAKGEFAGREDGQMIYAFSSDGKLIQFHYMFKKGSLDDFESLDKKLIAKYGNPNYSSEGLTVFDVDLKWYPQQTANTPIIWNGYAPVTGASLDGKRVSTFANNLLGINLYHYYDYSCKKYTQWFVKTQNGEAVLVDHCYIYLESYQADSKISKKSNYNANYYELVIYTHFSQDEVKQYETNLATENDDL